MAATCVDRIAKGDIPTKITDAYNGDFNGIKNNLNTRIAPANALVAKGDFERFRSGRYIMRKVAQQQSSRASTKIRGDFILSMERLASSATTRQ